MNSGPPAATPLNPAPPGWGDDDLTSFMRLAGESAWAAFVQPNTRRWFLLLQTIDRTFVRAIDALSGPTPNYFEGLMFVSAHAAFRGAAEFAVQARVCESMVLMRSCLEYAMYGIRFHRHPELIDVWAHRGDGEQQRNAVRNSFRPGDLFTDVTALNNAVGDRIRRLYELTIDMGAHPNETGFFGRLEIVDVAQGKHFKVKYLQGGEPAHLHALKTCAETGLCGFECFRLIYRERFDILGLTAEMERLIRLYQRMTRGR